MVRSTSQSKIPSSHDSVVIENSAASSWVELGVFDIKDTLVL